MLTPLETYPMTTSEDAFFADLLGDRIPATPDHPTPDDMDPTGLGRGNIVLGDELGNDPTVDLGDILGALETAQLNGITRNGTRYAAMSDHDGVTP